MAMYIVRTNVDAEGEEFLRIVAPKEAINGKTFLTTRDRELATEIEEAQLSARMRVARVLYPASVLVPIG